MGAVLVFGHAGPARGLAPDDHDVIDSVDRAAFAPFLDSIRQSAKETAEQLRATTTSVDTSKLTLADVAQLEESNMSAAGDAYIAFKDSLINGGASDIGLHPLYHVKLEVSPCASPVTLCCMHPIKLLSSRAVFPDTS